MSMLHDVLRFLVRQGPRTPVNQLRALMMIDGDEQGFQTVEELEVHLASLHPPQRLPRSNQEANEMEQAPAPQNYERLYLDTTAHTLFEIDTQGGLWIDFVRVGTADPIILPQLLEHGRASMERRKNAQPAR